MPKSKIDWVPLFRAQLKEVLVTTEGQSRSGWSVNEGRTGDMRLMYRPPGKTSDGARHKAATVALPYLWEARSTGEALRRIREIFLRVEQGKTLQAAAREVDGHGSNFDGPDWKQLIDDFRKYKVEKVGIDPTATWQHSYEPTMKAVLQVMASASPPFNGSELVEAVADLKELGSRPREIWIANVNQLLKFGQRRGLPRTWEQHAETKEALGATTQSANGVPLQDIEILELLADLPDTPRARQWRLAIQLMAVTGCRGSEIGLMKVIDGRLFCETKKRTAKSAGVLRPIAILPVMLPAGGTTDFDIVARLSEGEALPDIPYGEVGNALWAFLRRASDVWALLRLKYKKQGKKLVPCYSLRYRWVATAHRHGLPVSYMAEAAGHEPETAVRVYSRFDKEASREGVINEVLERIKQAAAV